MVVKHRILSIAAILIMTLFLGIGYASITDPLYVSGSSEIKPPTTLVIMDVTSISGTNVSSEVHSHIIPTNVKSTISGKKGQSVVYKITAHNFSTTDTFVFNGIEYDKLFDNTLKKMSVSVYTDESKSISLSTTPNDTCVSGTPIEPGEDFVFYVVYTLTENVTSEEVLIHYSFDTVVYSITYLDNNSTYAIDCVIDNSKTYNVRKDYPTAGYEGKHFAGWMNASANIVTSYPVGNTTSYTLTSKWDDIYTIMFVDRNGNVLYQEQFTSSSTGLSASGQQKVNQILAELNAEASMNDMTVTWSDYTIKGTKTDIVVRPNYTYTGNIQYQPVDTNGDGIIDHYKVVAIGHLDETVRILGVFNERPVLEVEKLYKNDNNFDYGSGVKTIIINEGVKTLAHNALSHTADLETVYLPSTIEYLDKNVFSRNWGDDKKTITIVYNGTMAEWKALTSKSHSDWDNGITTKNGSKVICTDGYFEFDYGFIGIGAKWKEYPN